MAASITQRFHEFLRPMSFSAIVLVGLALLGLAGNVETLAGLATLNPTWAVSIAAIALAIWSCLLDRRSVNDRVRIGLLEAEVANLRAQSDLATTRFSDVRRDLSEVINRLRDVERVSEPNPLDVAGKHDPKQGGHRKHAGIEILSETVSEGRQLPIADPTRDYDRVALQKRVAMWMEKARSMSNRFGPITRAEIQEAIDDCGEDGNPSNLERALIKLEAIRIDLTWGDFERLTAREHMSRLPPAFRNLYSLGD